MVKFYVVKIENGEINPKTELDWNIEDVPSLWKSKVEEALKE